MVQSSLCSLTRTYERKPEFTVSEGNLTDSFDSVFLFSPRKIKYISTSSLVKVFFFHDNASSEGLMFWFGPEQSETEGEQTIQVPKEELAPLHPRCTPLCFAATQHTYINIHTQMHIHSYILFPVSVYLVISPVPLLQ